MCIYIYIYISISLSLSLPLYIYIYIYIYVCVLGHARAELFVAPGSRWCNKDEGAERSGAVA